ncbi:MAG: ElyC/SanA/YdcF family protein [Evtepia sp.]|uniref:SanA/YdcF family protein n=1 Tax=Evtepia sp. TaxID=2773933 RepID=UPI002A75BF41|nr:ElyC/SanA/YdcF family protein [Evtepia sp.]MDY3013756.1 ElyC/SanA/YdcF family protein [Evtepia sp.]
MKEKTKKWIWLKRCVVALLAVVVLLVGLVFGGSAWVVTSTQDRLLSTEDTPPEGAECILVLGCSVRPDGSPSLMLADRLRRAVELYQAGWAPKLLMSGDNGQEEYNEVAVMKAWAMEHGVPSEDIVLDYAGFSTYDSVYRARDIFGVSRMIVVTQEYHMYRALYLARALGVEAWGVAAEGQNYPGQQARDLREILARDKDILSALLQPQPKYLGKKEPLTGTP